MSMIICKWFGYCEIALRAAQGKQGVGENWHLEIRKNAPLATNKSARVGQPEVRRDKAGPPAGIVYPKRKSYSVTARRALSPVTLAPETPARRSCRRDKSDHVHPVSKRLSVRAW